MFRFINVVFMKTKMEKLLFKETTINSDDGDEQRIKHFCLYRIKKMHQIYPM